MGVAFAVRRTAGPARWAFGPPGERAARTRQNWGGEWVLCSCDPLGRPGRTPAHGRPANSRGSLRSARASDLLHSRMNILRAGASVAGNEHREVAGLRRGWLRPARFFEPQESVQNVNRNKPAPGERHYTTGALYGVGSYGYSCSSTAGGTNGRHLFFHVTALDPHRAHTRAYDFQLRCLSE